MKAKNITAYMLEKNVNIRQGTFSQNINNKSMWSISTLITLSEYLKVSLDYLILGKENTRETELRQEIDQLILDKNRLRDTAQKLQKVISILNRGSLNESTGNLDEGKSESTESIA